MNEGGYSSPQSLLYTGPGLDRSVQSFLNRQGRWRWGGEAYYATAPARRESLARFGPPASAPGTPSPRLLSSLDID